MGDTLQRASATGQLPHPNKISSSARSAPACKFYRILQHGASSWGDRVMIASETPNPTFDKRFETDDNVFRSVFGTLSDEDWVKILVESISESEIAGVEFPSFPDEAFQSQLHGNSGEEAVVGASIFYRFVKERIYPNVDEISTAYFLDFAAGWGRISRLFLRDFSLKRMFAYEPNLAYCSIGRSCNPYINYLSGDYLPDGALPSGLFSLVVGWSIFPISQNRRRSRG